MRRDLRKLSVTNRTLGAPSSNQHPGSSIQNRWFEITNIAELGVAEIKLRGYIGMPTTERDWMTGELVASGGAGTLQEFEAALEALGPVKKIQLSIFSEGGDVFTGMAIHNLLVRHPANKTCVIDGICASAATYPALACKEIQIPSNAWMMIHGSEGCVCGNAQELRDYADMLDSVNASIINLYVARTGKTPEEITAMIEEETWMDGAKAVELGFADTVIEPLQNLASRASTIQPTNAAVLRHAPAEVLALFDMSAISNAARVPLPIAPMQTTAPAPTNAAPTTTAPAVSAAPVIETPAAPAAPVNAAPDLSTQITNAVNAAVAPLQAEITRLGSLAAHNVTPQNLGGAQPIAGAATAPAQRIVNRAEFAVMNAFQRAEFVRGGGKLTD